MPRSVPVPPHRRATAPGPLLPLLLLLLLLPTLPGCGGTTTAEVMRAALWPMGDLFVPRRDGEEPVRPPEWSAEPGDDVAETPEEGQALSLRLGSRRARAVLIQQQGERRLWRSVGGVVVATDGARIVATAGLRESVTATRIDGPDPLDDPRALLGRESDTRRTVDLAMAGRGPAGMRFGLALSCRLRAAAHEAEEVLLVEERCRGDARFINRFWADPNTGAVFRSEQWIGDATPPLVLEVRGN